MHSVYMATRHCYSDNLKFYYCLCLASVFSAGATADCIAHTTELMCYICAPHQNTFYKLEYFHVCTEFCQRWYRACGSAIIKGIPLDSSLPSLYSHSYRLQFYYTFIFPYISLNIYPQVLKSVTCLRTGPSSANRGSFE